MGFLPWAEPAPEQLLEAQPARCHRPERGNLDDHDVRHLSVQLLRDLQQTVHRPWVAAVAHIRNLGPDIPGFLLYDQEAIHRLEQILILRRLNIIIKDIQRIFGTSSSETVLEVLSKKCCIWPSLP